MRRRILIVLGASVSLGALMAQLGSNTPTDDQVNGMRIAEGGAGGAGIFDIPVPPNGVVLKPVKRVPRNKFGIVGPFPLQLQDLDGLTFPDASPEERAAMLEGMQFFTQAHTAAEGAGPMANQPFCLGCHMSSAETPNIPSVVNQDICVSGSTCVSIASRGARSTPTNFALTSLDPETGGGRAPGTLFPAPDGHPKVENLDALNSTGRTAAFTHFGDFNPTAPPNGGSGIGYFDALDGTANPVTGKGQQFGGLVQHVRPSIPECLPKPIPPVQFDANLQGTRDPVTGVDSKTGFRRTVGERAGPPYIGRGLMEAIPTADLMAMADPNDTQTSKSSLDKSASTFGCTGDCITGRANIITRNITPHTNTLGQITSVTGFVGGLGRFGLRSNGAEILQFVIGGLQGELSITSSINPSEANFPVLFPKTGPTTEPAACVNAAAAAGTIETHLSTPISERNFIRNIDPPEFGAKLLKVLNDPHGDFGKKSDAGMIKRGAQLFGIDVVAFANRMIPGRMPTAGDGLDPNAINQADRMLNCVGCHTPVQRTGQSPANVGARHLSFVWAPIFSDLLMHQMPLIDAERISPLPRNPLVIARVYPGEDGQDNRVFSTYDISRSLVDDTFSTAKALADGREFRTAPLMGMGRMGPPYLHDARVYLSRLTLDTNPAGTVTTNSKETNAPLVVRTIDDAILAAIEMHDLPAPDGSNTSKATGGGCPAPTNSNINYGSSPADVICPAYDSAVSKAKRSDAREVIRRFRALKPADQQAVIEFLKQL